MGPSRQRIDVPIPRLPWFLGLLLLAGLSGCGSAPSDEAAHVGSQASVGETQPMGTGSGDASACPRPDCGASSHGREAGPLAQEPARPDQGASASPSRLAPGTEPAPAETTGQTPLPEHRGLPDWIAAALGHRDVAVRLTALDRWAQQGPAAPLDPLVVALEDENDDVRTKALALIEARWAVEQKTSEEPVADSL